jgi:hypothetical protein
MGWGVRVTRMAGQGGWGVDHGPRSLELSYKGEER